MSTIFKDKLYYFYKVMVPHFMRFFLGFFGLLLIQDPIGNLPVTISLLKNASKQQKIQIIIRAHLIAFFTLTVFYLYGPQILNALHIRQEILDIIGAWILLTVAFKMVSASQNQENKFSSNETPWIVPLAIPLLAGPSAITYVMMSTKYFSTVEGIAMIGSVALVSTFILLSSIPLYQRLGANFIYALEKLIGMILLITAIKMLLNYSNHYFSESPSHRIQVLEQRFIKTAQKYSSCFSAR